MRIQLHSRNGAGSLRYSRNAACFGIYSHQFCRRTCLRSMTRSRASHYSRDSIAFSGSRSEPSRPEARTDEYVQGIPPAPAPRVEDPHQSPGGPLWVAGLALAAGLACSLVWRSLVGSPPDARQREQRQPQSRQAESAPLDSVRNLPQSIAASLSQDEEEELHFPNSLSAMKTVPVMNSSASLQADARAVQDRLTQQRRPDIAPSDVSAPDAAQSSARSSMPREAAETQDMQDRGAGLPAPQSMSAEAEASSRADDSSPEEDLGAGQGTSETIIQTDDSSAAAGSGASTAMAQADSADDAHADKTDAAASSGEEDRFKVSKAAAVSDEAEASTAESMPQQVRASNKPTDGNRETSASGPSTASDHANAEPSDADATAAAGEELHDLISSSSDNDADIPAAFKTFDSNLPDEPEPDLTQQGPKLFQSAPKTETSLPKPQGPQTTEDSSVTPPPEVMTKPGAESSASKEVMHPEEGTLWSQEQYEDQETNSALLDQASRKPLSELDVDSVPSSTRTPSQTDGLADSWMEPQSKFAELSSQAESQAEPQPESSQQPESETMSDRELSTGGNGSGGQTEEQAQGDEDAAQLRQRMQQLRQAMADKEAALAAAESQQHPTQQLSSQQQPKLQPSQQQQQEDAQPDQSLAQQSARVVPRPSASAESATIFIESPGADGDLQSHPIDTDQSEESDDTADDEMYGEEGIDLVALAAGAVLPHPDKVATGGEDAFFVSSHGQGAFGVADGVGGWNMEGVDPSRYSRLLMEHAEQAILQGQGDSEDGAREVVGLAHDSITWQGEQEGAVILGSSTICLGLVRPGGLLEMANVGDSGFRVIRGNETVFASEAQQHHFNMPFQLACPGPDQHSDTCENATVYELELEPGDVVLLATDGVLDNMWDDQIAHVVHSSLGTGQRSVSKAQECARAIVETAQENSFHPKFRSPWVVEAARAGVLPWWQRFKPEGGKVDDCTAVVICMEPASALQTSDAQKAAAGGSAAAVTAR